MSTEYDYGEYTKDTPLRIVERSDWGAAPVEETIRLRTPVREVLHTYTDTEPCYTPEECKKTLKEIQSRHMKEDGLTDIKYNFIIGGDLNVYEGRGWQVLPDLHPDHPETWETCLEISHIGRKGMPHEAIIEVAGDLLEMGVEKNFVKRGFDLHFHFYPAGEEDEEYHIGSTEKSKNLETDKGAEDNDKVKVIDCRGEYDKEFHGKDDEKPEDWEKELNSV